MGSSVKKGNPGHARRRLKGLSNLLTWHLEPFVRHGADVQANPDRSMAQLLSGLAGCGVQLQASGPLLSGRSATVAAWGQRLGRWRRRGVEWQATGGLLETKTGSN